MTLLRNVLAGMMLFAAVLVGLTVMISAASFIAGAGTFIVGAILAHVIHAGPAAQPVVIHNTNINNPQKPRD